jgi:hypothetical protein
MIRVLPRWCLLAILAVVTLAAPVAAQAPAPPAVDLQADPAWGVVLKPAGDSLGAYLDELGAKTGKGVVLLGFDGSYVTPRSFYNRPARELLVELAAKYRATWRSHAGFLLLYPPGMERHEAKPKAQTEIWKELGRSVSGVFTGDFMGVVQEVGYRTRTGLLPVGPGVSLGASDRAFMPCLLVLRERTLDEVMQLFTVLTGDPWDYWHDTHLLCFTGRQLSGEQRNQVGGTIAVVQLKRSVTSAQRKRVDTEGGLQYSDLTLRQKNDLATATAHMRARSGLGPEGLILRRTPSAPHLEADPFIDVYVRTPGGQQRVGSIRF